MSTHMRAVLVKDGKGGSDNLYLGETEKPKPEKGEVLVKVIAFGLNRMDIEQRNGRYPPPKGVTDVMGVEFSGTIAEFGEGVHENEGFKVGDPVMGLAYGGAYAEFVAISAKAVFPKPAVLSWEEAAGVPENFITAFLALIHIAELKEGESVLVHAGASGIGLAVAQLAAIQKAKHIFTTTSSSEKVSYLESTANGPTNIINYRTQDFVTEIKKVTDGKGVDVIIDFIGQSYWDKNIDALAIGGRMILLGFLSGHELKSTSIAPVLFKRLRIQGSTLRSRTQEYQADLIARFAKDFLPKFKDGSLKVHVHRAYSWEKIREAHDEMEENKNIGKIAAVIS